MRDGLGISLIEIENARSLRERPTNPDAFNLILRGRSIRNLPPTLQRDIAVFALLERALLRVLCCTLDGSGSHLVIFDVVEGTHPGTEQRDAGPCIHCPLEHFQSVYLPFGLTVAPDRGRP